MLTFPQSAGSMFLKIEKCAYTPWEGNCGAQVGDVWRVQYFGDNTTAQLPRSCGCLNQSAADQLGDGKTQCFPGAYQLDEVTYTAANESYTFSSGYTSSGVRVEDCSGTSVGRTVPLRDADGKRTCNWQVDPQHSFGKNECWSLAPHYRLPVWSDGETGALFGGCPGWMGNYSMYYPGGCIAVNDGISGYVQSSQELFCNKSESGVLAAYQRYWGQDNTNCKGEPSGTDFVGDSNSSHCFGGMGISSSVNLEWCGSMK
jgi:hypothetical protein